MGDFQVLVGDAAQCLSGLADESVHCVVTSPPYFGLRDYKVDGQIGREGTVREYIENLVSVFKEVKRVLRKDGCVWVNIGDSFCNDSKWGGRTTGKHASALHGSSIGRQKRKIGLPPKSLMGIPWRLAIAMQDDGWTLRCDVIWEKPNCLPENVRDRPTRSHEYVFLFSKSPKYYFDHSAMQERAVCDRVRGPAKHRCDDTNGNSGLSKRQPTGLRNRRSVWRVMTKPFRGAHFAVMPVELVDYCILAGCPEGGVVLDPFLGSGTVIVSAISHGRDGIGCELNPEYARLAKDRISKETQSPESRTQK